jgi:hypothetical protein
MEPKYLEVLLSKIGRHGNEYFRVYIELTDEDKELLNCELNADLKTRFIVWHAGVLDLLPSGIVGNWYKTGRIIEEEIIESWASGIDPTIRDGKPNVWVIPGG